MKQAGYRGYTIKAKSREDPPGSGKWYGTWTAIRLDKPGAETSHNSVLGTFRTESEADEAACQDARSWVEKFGSPE